MFCTACEECLTNIARFTQVKIQKTKVVTPAWKEQPSYTGWLEECVASCARTSKCVTTYISEDRSKCFFFDEPPEKNDTSEDPDNYVSMYTKGIDQIFYCCSYTGV